MCFQIKKLESETVFSQFALSLIGTSPLIGGKIKDKIKINIQGNIFESVNNFKFMQL